MFLCRLPTAMLSIPLHEKSASCDAAVCQITANTCLTRYRPGGGETICPRRWLFDGGISFRRQSGHRGSKIAPDLRPSADGSAVRTSLAKLQAASVPIAQAGSCAMGQIDGRIALFKNAPSPRAGA